MGQVLGSLIDRARRGEDSAAARLLPAYREYLKLLARVQIRRRLQGKVDASDLVQETLLDAHRQLGHFKGNTEAELIAWLRKILAGQVAMMVRRYFGAEARDVRLERGIAAQVDRSSHALEAQLIGMNSTPSQRVARREQTVLLADALQRLRKDYREAVVLRHLEGLSLSETAMRMGRSANSVQKLYVRGLVELRRIMGGLS